MVQTRSKTRQFKLDVRSQKAQGIYKNTNNSLTGASASSAGAIHHTTTNEPMVSVGPRRSTSKTLLNGNHKSSWAPPKRTAKKSYVKGVLKNKLRASALGMPTKKQHKKSHCKKGGGRHSYSSHGVRYHKHKQGVKRKRTAYCKRP